MNKELKRAAERGAEKALSKRRISLRTLIMFPILMVGILGCFIVLVIIFVGILAG